VTDAVFGWVLLKASKVFTMHYLTLTSNPACCWTKEAREEIKWRMGKQEKDKKEEREIHGKKCSNQLLECGCDTCA